LVLKLTEGTVKWFNNRKGYGFIATEEGDIFVHHSAIVKKGDEFATLNENDKVEFEIVEGEKGPAASKVVVTEAAPAQYRNNRY
jgi:CspA family cold shock protein